MQKPKALSIGQLGKAIAIKVETIRYYEQIGLLPVPARTSGNYRSYADDHVRLLGFVRRARELGFSIAEIRELLGLERFSVDVNRNSKGVPKSAQIRFGLL